MSKDALSKDSEKKDSEADFSYQHFGISLAVIIIISLTLLFVFKDNVQEWFKKRFGKSKDLTKKELSDEEAKGTDPLKSIDELDDDTAEQNK